MSKFAILADATCDLTEEYIKKYEIEMIPGHVKLPDGREITIGSEWGEFENADNFYSQLKKNPNGFTTSPGNVNECEDAMRKYASQGIPVVVISISSGISGSHNNKLTARETVLKDYPDAVIECLDSMRFGPGFGLLVYHAAQMRDAGKSIQEVADYVEKNKNRYHQTGWLDDLSFVAKKGRLTNAKAFFGTLAGVKPLGEFDYNGLTTVIGKAKGAKAAYPALLRYIEAEIENPEEQDIFIAQTGRYPQAVEFKKMIEEKFHPKSVNIYDVHPLCGVNIGTGLMAAYYVGKPISQGLVDEKELMEKLISGEK